MGTFFESGAIKLIARVDVMAMSTFNAQISRKQLKDRLHN